MSSPSPNSAIRWETMAVERSQREQLQGSEGGVIWLTGLSGAGKSTIAREAELRLHRQGLRTYVLDGDNLRHGLNSDLGFSAADRKENLRRAAEVARILYDAGTLVLCSFIAPFAAERAFARSLVPANRFWEVYVRCPVDECARRDPKGLYAKASQGLITNLTGVGAPYEEPQNPDLILDTCAHGLNDCIAQLLRALPIL